MAEENPFGDNQGTRVGRPSTPQRDNVKDGSDAGITTDSGAESARGIQADRSDKTTSNEAGKGNESERGDRPGSEPLTDRKHQDTPSYGGDMGQPRPVPDES